MRNEQLAHPRFDIETQAANEDIAVGRNDRHRLELNLVRFKDDAAAFQN